MKRTLIICKPVIYLVAIFLFKSGVSQINIVNRTLLSPDSNVLFVGITNSIEVINTKNPFFEIRAGKSALSSTTHPYIFEVRSTQPGVDTIVVSDGDQVILKKAFKITFLPTIEAKLGTLRKEEATQEEILINGWLVLTIPNCKCSPAYEVTSFQLEFDGDDVDEEIIAIEGNRFTTKAKKIIKSLKSGDTVYFEKIIAKNEEGKSIQVPDFSLTVQ
jgi:hypothetical protein